MDCSTIITVRYKYQYLNSKTEKFSIRTWRSYRAWNSEFVLSVRKTVYLFFIQIIALLLYIKYYFIITSTQCAIFYIHIHMTFISQLMCQKTSCAIIAIIPASLIFMRARSSPLVASCVFSLQCLWSRFKLA